MGGEILQIIFTFSFPHALALGGFWVSMELKEGVGTQGFLPISYQPTYHKTINAYLPMQMFILKNYYQAARKLSQLLTMSRKYC